MSEPRDLDTIAQHIKSAQDSNTCIEPITQGERDFDLSRAYAVAHQIHEARLAEGASRVGRKIGFTNSSIWPQYGVDAPIWGYIYDTTLIKAEDGRAACGVGRYAEPKIEPEIVLHFAETPPADGDLKAVVACVDWVAHAFEIVQSHYPGWRFKAADTVADSALHGALVLGEAVTVDALGPDPALALESFTLKLFRDGDLVETGKGANVLGGPVAAVAHLIDSLSTQPEYPPLQAGELVTTGTLTAAYSISAGEVWASELEGIAVPGLEVSLKAGV